MRAGEELRRQGEGELLKLQLLQFDGRTASTDTISADNLREALKIHHELSQEGFSPYDIR